MEDKNKKSTNETLNEVTKPEDGEVVVESLNETFPVEHK